MRCNRDASGTLISEAEGIALISNCYLGCQNGPRSPSPFLQIAKKSTVLQRKTNLIIYTYLGRPHLCPPSLSAVKVRSWSINCPHCISICEKTPERPRDFTSTTINLSTISCGVGMFGASGTFGNPIGSDKPSMS